MPPLIWTVAPSVTVLIATLPKRLVTPPSVVSNMLSTLR